MDLGSFTDVATTIGLSASIPANTVYWMSFQLRVATPVSDRLFFELNPTGIQYGQSPVFFFSNGSVLNINNGGPAASLVNGDNFIVIRRTQSPTYGAGHSQFDVWVNPLSTNVFASAGDIAREIVGFNGGITSIGVGGYSTSSTFDNLRIGTALLDVVMIPEPSTALLFVTGGWLLLRRFRRRG